MGINRWGTSVVALALIAGLAGCGSVRGGGSGAESEGAARTSDQEAIVGKDVIAPVTLPAAELEGERVELVVGQVLVVDTAERDVASYRAELSDPEVAVFAAGHRDDGAEFAPGITALAVGDTDVVLTHEQGGVEPIHFEVVVTPAG